MLNEAEIMARIDAIPIEELVEMVKKAFEDSHVPYTIEEGGQILWLGLNDEDKETAWEDWDIDL